MRESLGLCNTGHSAVGGWPAAQQGWRGADKKRWPAQPSAAGPPLSPAGCEGRCDPNLFSQTPHAQITACFQRKGAVLLQKHRGEHCERPKGLPGCGETLSPTQDAGAFEGQFKTQEWMPGAALRRGLLSVTFPRGHSSEMSSLRKTLSRSAFCKPRVRFNTFLLIQKI